MELTRIEDWKKVDTAENPADISSRGMDLSDLKDSELFFHGPKWLTNKLVQFKNVGEITPDNISLDAEEVKKTSQMKGPQMNVLFASVNEEDDVLKKVLERHNNWRKSVKTISWIRRFWTNTKQKVDQQKQMKPSDQSRKMTLRQPKKQKKTTPINYEDFYLNPDERTRTEDLLFKYAQSQEFSNEISLLSTGLEIPKNSKIKKLLPIWDEDSGLLKHDSRIIGYLPTILPKDHLVTKLFIHDIHKKFGHSGPTQTLHKVRKRVWITAGRQQIKKSHLQMQLQKKHLAE